jgi:hypothetical protein
MKAGEERYLKGAEKIEEVFQNGFILDSKVLHYVDSTYSNPSSAEIEKILTGDSDYEKEALFKLIFFPDESTRILLEEFFIKEDIREEESIRAYFSGKNTETKIKFPDKRETIHILLPPRFADVFISHLNISKRFGEKLIKAISAVSCDKKRVFTRIKLKDTGKSFSEKDEEFIALFLEKFGEEKKDFRECLDLVIEVLSEKGDDADIYNAFSYKKAASYRSLLHAERFEKQLERDNIETLLLQGIRPVSVDKDAALRKMRLIDRICLAVFGKTEYCEKNLIGIQTSSEFVG